MTSKLLIYFVIIIVVSTVTMVVFNVGFPIMAPVTVTAEIIVFISWKADGN